jgi:dCTP deaminase
LRKSPNRGFFLFIKEDDNIILSDKTIRSLLSKGRLGISPLEDTQIQSASVDIRLGNSFSVIDENISTLITMKSPVKYHNTRSSGYRLYPKEFVLASTMEYIHMPDNLTAFVEGRSPIGRLGLFIQNAGWVDPGFEGEITLELYNAGRHVIKLEPGRRIGQLVFAKLDRKARNPYRGKYQGQRSATGSRIQMDEEL